MQITLTELKLNVGRYVEMASAEDVAVTRYGKPAAKLIRFDKKARETKQAPEEIAETKSRRIPFYGFSTKDYKFDRDEANAR